MKANAIGKNFQMHRLCGWWKTGLNGKETETKSSSYCYSETSGFPVEVLVCEDCKTQKTKQNIRNANDQEASVQKTDKYKRCCVFLVKLEGTGNTRKILYLPR